MTTQKEAKFPKFDKDNPQKFFEACLKVYKEQKERWDREVDAILKEDLKYVKHKILSLNRIFSRQNIIEARKVLFDTETEDEMIVAAILASFARLCIEMANPLDLWVVHHVDLIIDLTINSPCWCCVLKNMKPRHFICEVTCPATAYCFAQEDVLGLRAYARNVVLAVCRRHGYASVWRWLPESEES